MTWLQEGLEEPSLLSNQELCRAKFRRYSQVNLERDGRYHAYHSKNSHDAHKLEPIRVEGKFYFFRVKNVTNQTSLRCEEASVLDQTIDWLVAHRAGLDDRRASKESVLLAALVRVDFRGYHW